MKIETTSRLTNLSVVGSILVLLALPVLMIITNNNLKNASPDRYYSVQIEGEPIVKEVVAEERPIENPEAIKSWVKSAVIQYFNYDANNYKKVIESGRDNFTASFFKPFKDATEERIEANIKAGYYISSSIVELDPILVKQAVIDGDSYYKYYLRLNTVYKSEMQTIIKNPKVFVTVKFEKPSSNVRGIAIADLTISR
ncbi:hypothetical protein GR140_18850 [Pseudomonas putida]|uniref:DotI/IcmL/TraM family protein n=1 Tax=Pseudomonas putida TaxID=303 RepID=UPI001BB06EDD|nr:DotI/IcmL/TraM family protein [Pseudomonas putida]QUG90724.1 hypothetical protein GR140_18850 [Pseudomonas putida]